MTPDAERPKTREDKRAICNQCPRRVAGRYVDTCSICNCYIVVIVLKPRCPIGNW